jgi:hypothetical protein
MKSGVRVWRDASIMLRNAITAATAADSPSDNHPTSSRRHPAVRVVWSDQDADIDETIAPLILEMWKAGVRTANSCEDNLPQGFVWIQFRTTQDAERFLNIIGEFEDDDPAPSRYRRMLGEGEWPNEWRYAIGLEDWAVDWEVDEDGLIIETRGQDRPILCFWVSIRFPRSDLSWVTERIAYHNGRTEARAVVKASAG